MLYKYVALTIFYLFLSSGSVNPLFKIKFLANNAGSTCNPKARDLYQAYLVYKNGDNNQTIQMMKKMGYTLERTFHEKIEPEGQLDSLVFKIDNKAIAIFHAVDLLYAKFVDATFSIKTDQSLYLLLDFRDLLEKEGLKIKAVQCDKAYCYKYEDAGEYWIKDLRWINWHYDKLTSPYSHLLAAKEEYLLVKLTDTLSENWVTKDQVPVAKR